MIEIEKPNISTVNLSEDGRSGKLSAATVLLLATL